MKATPVRLRRCWRIPPKKVLVVLVLLGLIGFAIYTALAMTVVPAYHQREAARALKRRDLEAARGHLDVCLKAWPASVPVRLLAARAAWQAKRYDEAEQHLNLCHRLDGTAGEAVQLERDLIQTQRGSLARMEALYPLVENGHPDETLILEVMAEAWRTNYQFRHAQHCLNQWLEREPNSVLALTKRGALLDAMDRFAEAAIDFTRIIEELDPDNDAVRQQLAICLLLSLGQPEEAEKHLQILRERRPDDEDVLWALATAWRQMGRLQEAAQLLDEMLARHPTHLRGLTERGRLAMDQDQPVAAERFLRAAAQAWPSDYQANFLLSLCLQQVGKTEEAQQFRDRAERTKKDMDRLQEITKQRMPENPKGPELRYEAGMIFLRLGEPEDAVRWFHNALREDPRHAPTHQALADYYQKIGDLTRADHHRRLAEANTLTKSPSPPVPR